MEPMVIKDIKTSVIKESINECYLNPKDNIINEHYNQLLFKNLDSNLLFYLPLNEILALVLEDKIVIYDLKISITENLKILDEIYYNNDIINIYNNKTQLTEKTKVDKNKNQKLFLGLNFMDKEQEDKQVKNILISDDFFNIKGNFIIIIEFMNLDIYIISYNLLSEINNKPKMTLISKQSKIIFNDNINKYEENISKNISKSKMEIIVNHLTKKIFLLYLHKNIFLIYDFILNEINNNINNNSLSHQIITLKNDISHFDANYCSCSSFNYLEFILVSVNNKCYYILFLHNADKNKYNMILNEEIKIENKSNISNIKYYKNTDATNNNNYEQLFNEKIFFIIQLNQVFIIKYCIKKDSNDILELNICYKYLINFNEFYEEQIYNIFFLQNKFLYAFTRKNKYIEYLFDLNKLKNNINIEIIDIKEKSKYFKIAKFIYDIKPFQSENGFFLLVTQYPARPINMNIIYKINNKNIISVKNNFSEGLIIGLRYNNYNNNIFDKNSNNYFLFYKRFEYFLNKIYKGQNNLLNEMDIEEKINNNNINNNDDNENENKFDDLMEVNSHKYKEGEKKSEKDNNIIKKDIINFFLKKLEKNIEIDEYKKYLNNKKYQCEFCNKEFINFDKEKMIYKCDNNDITFSCCISYKPINDCFLWCSYCNLFYSDDINIFYCFICDRILSKLDSL